MVEEPGTRNLERKLEVAALGNGRYRVSDGATQWLLYAVKSPEGTWVFFEGAVYVIDTAGPKGPALRDVSTQRRAHDDEMALASPMPATVVSIHVAPGQDVLRGDLLVMLEAMKMELSINAPRDGRIRTIGCRPGEIVQPGVPLIDLA